jgi:hypothetical protein
MSNVEQVLAKLARVQAIGTRGRIWFAKCPTDAHNLGGNSTLEVRRLDGGQVWLRCHGRMRRQRGV